MTTGRRLAASFAEESRSSMTSRRKMRIGILIFNKQAFESGKGRLPVESDKAKIDELIAEVMNEAGVK